MTFEICKTMRDKKEPARFEQFQTEQISYLQRSINRLRSSWVNSVRDIIEASLKKGQSNWMTTNPEPLSYSDSKLQKYFKIVKFMMEDAIR